VRRASGGLELRNEMVLPRKDVTDMNVEVRRGDLRQRDEQPLRPTRPEALDEMEDAHRARVRRPSRTAPGSDGRWRYGPSVPGSALELRRATDADLPAVLELLRASLGQESEHHEAFFRWKHVENPFGPSPSWVATDDNRIVGFRTFLRWEFASAGRVVRAVRAVDTATHPEYQGRGVFRALTLRALDELRAEGVEFVFNTPNEQSRPGYLKMGWREVGRLRVGVIPTTAGWFSRAIRSRVPASRWSLSTNVGDSAAEALMDGCGVAAELGRGDDVARGSELRTRRTLEFLRWRYAGFAPIGYRAYAVPCDGGDGFVLFRLRRRGATTEAIIGDVVGPAPMATPRRSLARLGREAGADVVLGVRDGQLAKAFIPLPRMGPVLTTRTFADDGVPRLHLVLGDVELM